MENKKIERVLLLRRLDKINPLTLEEQEELCDIESQLFLGNDGAGEIEGVFDFIEKERQAAHGIITEYVKTNAGLVKENLRMKLLIDAVKEIAEYTKGRPVGSELYQVHILLTKKLWEITENGN